MPAAPHNEEDLGAVIDRLTVAWPEGKPGSEPEPVREWPHPRHHYDLMLVSGFVVAVDIVCASRDDIAKAAAVGEALRKAAGGFPDAWFIASTLTMDQQRRARIAGFGWCLCHWPASARIRALSRRAPQQAVGRARRRASAVSTAATAF